MILDEFTDEEVPAMNVLHPPVVLGVVGHIDRGLVVHVQVGCLSRAAARAGRRVAAAPHSRLIKHASPCPSRHLFFDFGTLSELARVVTCSIVILVLVLVLVLVRCSCLSLSVWSRRAGSRVFCVPRTLRQHAERGGRRGRSYIEALEKSEHPHRRRRTGAAVEALEPSLATASIEAVLCARSFISGFICLNLLPSVLGAEHKNMGTARHRHSTYRKATHTFHTTTVQLGPGALNMRKEAGWSAVM
jgi:hypothetical protein